MRTIFAPEELKFEEDEITIFCAGSIEMGTAEMWVDELEDKLKGYKNVVLFNPRRKDFDPKTEQSKDNPYFRGQVEWELKALETADIIYMYLQPGTKSPISLLEFGIYTQTDKLMVCCPEGFYRQANVQITGEYYNIPVYGTKEEIFEELLKRIKFINY